jgi:hypothetical protein
LFKWDREDLINSAIIVPVHKKGYKPDCNNYRGISLQSNSYKILSDILLSKLSAYINEINGIISVPFNITNQLLIRNFAFVRYWRKTGNTMEQYIYYS